MSISDEITRINTNIANAYTKVSEKGGTLPETQNSANLANTIDTIPSGGSEVESKDIDFIDYDGTILYSYTLQEMQNLSALPALPSHDGLTCQGWNYTLADAKQLDKGGVIGTNYITSDGKTRIYVNIPEDSDKLFGVCFIQTKSQGVEIDWGDGTTTERLNSTGVRDKQHTYSQGGKYIVTLNPDNDCEITLGGDNNNYTICSYNYSGWDYLCNRIYRVELGKNITTLGSYTFRYVWGLETITIPNTITSIKSNFTYGYSANLKSFVVPSQVTNVANSFNNSYCLKNISLPVSLQSVSENFCANCRSLKKICFPKNVSTIGTYSLQNCSNLQSLVLPNGIQNLPDSFAQYIALSEVVFPQSIISIGGSSFTGCSALIKYDFSNALQIPTLGSSYIFNPINSNCKIIVPDSLYESWKTAQYWSSFARYIIKASDT